MEIIGDMNAIVVNTFGIASLKIQRLVQVNYVNRLIGTKRGLDEEMKPVIPKIIEGEGRL